MAQGNAPRLRRRGSKRCISTDLLKIIGLLLTVQGTLGVALLQNGLLHMGDRTQLELWDLIQTDQNAAQVLAWSILSKGMVSLAGHLCLPGSGGAAAYLQLPPVCAPASWGAVISEDPL